MKMITVYLDKDLVFTYDDGKPFEDQRLVLHHVWYNTDKTMPIHDFKSSLKPETFYSFPFNGDVILSDWKTQRLLSTDGKHKYMPLTGLCVVLIPEKSTDSNFEKAYKSVVGTPGTHELLPLSINATCEYLRKDLVEKIWNMAKDSSLPPQ